jgi:hypothetical protein
MVSSVFQVPAFDNSPGRDVALTLDGSQKDFPVIQDGVVVGALRQADLLRGPHDHGKLCRVDRVTREPHGLHHRYRQVDGVAVQPPGAAGACEKALLTA